MGLRKATRVALAVASAVVGIARCVPVGRAGVGELAACTVSLSRLVGGAAAGGRIAGAHSKAGVPCDESPFADVDGLAGKSSRLRLHRAVVGFVIEPVSSVRGGLHAGVGLA